jgi:hypothetical protein
LVVLVESGLHIAVTPPNDERQPASRDCDRRNGFRQDVGSRVDQIRQDMGGRIGQVRERLNTDKQNVEEMVNATTHVG